MKSQLEHYIYASLCLHRFGKYNYQIHVKTMHIRTIIDSTCNGFHYVFFPIKKFLWNENLNKILQMFAQNLHSAYFLNSSISMRLFFWIHLYLNLFQHLSFHTLFHLVHSEVHNEINRCTSCQKGHKIMRQKCSPELAFRSTDICAPENLIFSALSTQP